MLLHNHMQAHTQRLAGVRDVGNDKTNDIDIDVDVDRRGVGEVPQDRRRRRLTKSDTQLFGRRVTITARVSRDAAQLAGTSAVVAKLLKRRQPTRAGRSDGKEGTAGHPFTAPAVIPAITCFWKMA